MKKQIIKSTLVLSSAILLFASCKKDYTCKCTGSGSNNGTDYEVAATIELNKQKEEDAKSTCNANQSTLSQQNGNISVNCALSAK